MSQHLTKLQIFQQQIKESQQLWALLDKESEDWVVMDSIQFAETDVLPLWSSESLAQAHCIEEWENYTPKAISVSDWFEFWLEDLVKDDVIVGINWLGQEDDVELGLSEFTEAIAEIESL